VGESWIRRDLDRVRGDCDSEFVGVIGTRQPRSYKLYQGVGQVSLCKYV
jgi:hypothetical protein